MPEYLVSARSPDGRKITERMEASSPDEVVKLLESRLYSEIVLHTGEIEAFYDREMKGLKPDACQSPPVVPPREFLRMRLSSTFLGQVLFLVRTLYIRCWWTFVIPLAFLAFRWSNGVVWDDWDQLLAAWCLVPFVLAPLIVLFGAGWKYNRVIDAYAWGRWNAVLNLLPALDGHVLAHEIAFRRAVAQAALGQLDEALQGVKPYSDGKEMPFWMYLGRLSEVYSAARDVESTVAAMEKCAELAPHEPTALLDCATTLIRRKRDVRRARHFLDEARKHPISDVIAFAVDQCQGMISLEEGHALEARDYLNQALEKIRPFRHASPLMGSAVDRIHAYLALANAAAGDLEVAAKHYRIAEPRLRALNYDDLIERCEAALDSRSRR